MECFIYYRVAANTRHAVPQALIKLRALLGASDSPRLLRRPDSKDGMDTWMEIYSDMTPALAQKLELALPQTGLPQLIAGERHAEYFVEA